MKKRIISIVLSLLLVIGLVPSAAMTSFAADLHDGEVRVIISNDTYPAAEGAPWEGTLVDEWVEIGDDSTMMSCVVAALDNNGYEQSGAENNYISTINGLSEFDGGEMSGWMGTLNDWFTNCGFGDFTVAAGNLGAGDEIHIMYTCAYGDDLGGSWGNTGTWISSIVFSAGTLDKDFNPGYTSDSGAYTLTLPTGTTEVNVMPTAANKNYMVRIFLNAFEENAATHYGDYEFKRNDLIPVKNGDTIYVGCGREAWPSMNESDGGHVYAFNVIIPEEEKQTEDEQKADYKTVLNNTLAQLAVTVDNPTFGTGGGEWSVLSLARGGYFAADDPYFETYYSNVEKTVPGLAETAAGKGVKEGGLDKNKSTENSRLILALAAIGKDPTNVGGVNVLGAYDANGFNWIKKQGINGPIFTLIALDTKNYQTKSTSEDGNKTIRQQCVDFILSKELANGGWALSGAAADPDITAMALQALVNYKNDANVSAAASRAIDALSGMQQDNGGFASWGSVNSESIAQVITALSAWKIDADKDSRFVKKGGSALDALLTFYIPESKGFAHVLTDGNVNAMATDQASYALVAYDRYRSGKTSLYDMTDVKTSVESGSAEETTELAATLTLPEKIENKAGTSFNAVINLNGFPEDYRLLDSIITIPEGVTVTDVKMGSRIVGGEVSWSVEEKNGKLRIVYFDAQKKNVIKDSGTGYPLELMTISLKLEKAMTVDSVSVAISGMSMKKTSDSETQNIIKTASASDTVKLAEGISFSAMILYTGDDIDLIPASKTAIAVAVTGIQEGTELTYNDGTDSIPMLYNAAVSEKTGVSTYLAIISSDKALKEFVDRGNYTFGTGDADTIKFGDTNKDGIINAQDALNTVNYWLRKTEAPKDSGILAANVTGDSRINTFDALGIVEHFVDGSEFAIVNQAATVKNAVD